MQLLNTKQAGFAHVGIIVMAVVIIAVAAVGVRITRQGQTAPSRDKSNNTATQKVKQPGTIAGIEAVNQEDINNELKAADALTEQEQKEAQSQIQAIGSIGEGYEVNF